MEQVTCVLCNIDDTVTLLTGKDARYGTTSKVFPVVKCRKCGLVYVNPRPPKDRMGIYYPENYRTRETMQSASRITKRMVKYRTKRKAFLFRNPWHVGFSPNTAVLDIGCGAGELLLLLREIGCVPYGLDVNPETSRYLRETMHLNVTTGDIDAGTSFGDNFFDVVVMRHSLEHLHNPLNALREVNRMLKKSGMALIGVPNIGGWVPKITGAYWRGLDIPRHLFHFTPETLETLLSRAGLTTETVYHEFKFSRDSLRDWMKATYAWAPVPPRWLTNFTGMVFSLLRRGEWIVITARK